MTSGTTASSHVDIALSEINLVDPDVYIQGLPHHWWRVLRAQAPIYQHPASGLAPEFWAITRYADIIRISRDPQTFSSAAGIHAYSRMADRDPTLGRMMITSDPPRHVRLRRLVSTGFTPRMVAKMEPHIRRIVTNILDDVAPKGACDFVTEIAAKLPLAVICDMVGVPPEDAQKMFDFTNRALGSEDPEYQQPGNSSVDTGAGATWEMMYYFTQLIQAHRQQPKDDLLTVLLDAEIDGEKLDDNELLFFCFLLIVAGNETTRNATSGGLLALFDHPDQRAKLLANPELLPSAIEEILRWTSPVLHMARFALEDAEVGGQLIRKGEKVILWYPSANRDEAVFPDPDRFDIARTPNEHLAFGIGEHFCLGASLARLELRVMFEELNRRLPDLQPAGPVERLRSNFIGGIKHLPVRFAGQSVGA